MEFEFSKFKFNRWIVVLPTLVTVCAYKKLRFIDYNKSIKNFNNFIKGHGENKKAT